MFTEKEFDKAFKLHCHADTLYHHRIDFFLITEAMLVTAYVTSLSFKDVPVIIGYGISIIGIFLTSIWLGTNARLGERVIYMIRNYLKQDVMYKFYIESVGGWYSKAFLSYGMPLSLNLLWIFFLIHTLNYFYIFFVMVITSCIMIYLSYRLNYKIVKKNKVERKCVKI